MTARDLIIDRTVSATRAFSIGAVLIAALAVAAVQAERHMKIQDLRAQEAQVAWK